MGGGLQGGPESIAVAGWTVYLLGQLAAALARQGQRGVAAAAAACSFRQAAAARALA